MWQGVQALPSCHWDSGNRTVTSWISTLPPRYQVRREQYCSTDFPYLLLCSRLLPCLLCILAARESNRNSITLAESHNCHLLRILASPHRCQQSDAQAEYSSTCHATT